MNVLLASHSPALTTGYGRVTRTLADAFHAAGLGVAVFGMGHEDGAPHGRPYPVLPCPPEGPEDAIAQFVRREMPDVLLTIGDPWMFPLVPHVPGLGGTGPTHWL